MALEEDNTESGRYGKCSGVNICGLEMEEPTGIHGASLPFREDGR